MGNGHGSSGGQAERPIELPPNLPQELRDFLECRVDSATIANGPVAWINGRPNLAVKPGAAPGTATLAISVAFFTVTLPAAVVGGKLSIDTTALPGWVPASAAADVGRFVDALNGSLARNGKGLGPPAFGPGGMTLTKVDLPESPAA